VHALADTAALEMPGVSVRRDEPLARHTSMRVGGPADLYCEVEDVAALSRLLAWASGERLPVFALGGGTNLVVADRGIRGVVVKFGRGFRHVDWQEDAAGARVRVGAGANFKRLVVESVGRGLAGLEFGEGIPGTVGGGVIMNAGAFGGEIAGVTEALHAVQPDGRPVRLTRAELRFAYRRLDLPPGLIVTGLEIRLVRGAPGEIASRIADARSRRGRRQPLGLPNAGSIFKNPPGHFAGRLIERVGLKGHAIGGAQISPQHANFIVNTGGARAVEVRALLDLARERVLAECGVRLDPEVKLVGEW
jgi:UDP-N-acetylmuramate dehydrogenase